MELRGHEHVVECAIFLPTNSYPFLWEWLNVHIFIKITTIVMYSSMLD